MEGSTITIARWELYAMIAAIVLGPLIVNEAWRAATPSAATAQVASVVRGIFAPWSRLARPWYRAGGMHVTPLISVGTIVVPALFFGGAVRAAGIHFFALWLAFGVALIASSLRGWDKEFYVGFILPLYVMVIFAAPALVPAGHVASLAAAGVAGMLVKIGVCMSIGLHRYAAHAAFKCGPVVRFGLSVLGCLANQGGPIWWGSKHRCHHSRCDKEHDPHSPLISGAIDAFQFHTLQEHKDVDPEYRPSHCDTYGARLIDTFSFVPVSLELALSFVIGGPAALWVCYVSGWLSQTLALWFNVINHSPTDKTELHPCASGDSTHFVFPVAKNREMHPNALFAFFSHFQWVAQLTGESAHDHHHDHSSLARRPGVDLPYHLLVRPLHAAGLIWGLKLPK